MEGFVLTTVTNIPVSTANNSSSLSINASLLFPSLITRARRKATKNLSFHRRSKKFSVFAAKDDPKVDPWDQMELKFGRMIGEDPKLTMAKIMARKSNPDASYLEVEKSFQRKNGKVVDVKEVPFEASKDAHSSSSTDGLNLVRPVPKEGVKFQTDNKPRAPEYKKPSQSNGKSTDSTRSSVPNVILRKPTIVNEDDVEDMPSRLRIKRNLSLSMSNQPVRENFSDMTLLRKPQAMPVDSNLTKEPDSTSDGGSLLDEHNTIEVKEEASGFTLIKKPDALDSSSKHNDKQEQAAATAAGLTANGEENGFEDESGWGNVMMEELEELPEDVHPPRIAGTDESQLHNQTELRVDDEESRQLGTVIADSTAQFSVATSLQKKPMRLQERSNSVSSNEVVERVPPASESPVDAFELGNPSASSEFKESEDADWTRAKNLVKTGEREKVELISSSTRGFAVSFGSLIGFLPYRNLAAKWKFLAFESWLRQKGLDPANYKQNLGVIGTYDAANKSASVTGGPDPPLDKNFNGEISLDMKLEDLLRIYDHEKLKFLNSFIGQKVKVNVLVADRKFRKLVFSVRPKEKEELVEKKRSLMAKLQIGDVVKCCITKITYFGIFVEVEGVPALIHQTEVSWDATLDPMAFFKLGQIVEAKVHQLDFSLERIFLSLKETTPDPLIEALESVVRDSSLDGNSEAAQIETEWAEVDSLIKELEQIEGVQTVSKGRFFLSPGLAPTFQVYMASMFENQYKLLARAGNRVQELIVESSLDKEEMKAVILTCTNRVE